mmetsp:Transcript_109100/g.273353  ORF Transcript_109100/g.273353 Transcript_109100/m.273353 type:complete len:208 (+) Transcript_109100:249-872(+)
MDSPCVVLLLTPERHSSWTSRTPSCLSWHCIANGCARGPAGSSGASSRGRNTLSRARTSPRPWQAVLEEGRSLLWTSCGAEVSFRLCIRFCISCVGHSYRGQQSAALLPCCPPRDVGSDPCFGAAAADRAIGGCSLHAGVSQLMRPGPQRERLAVCWNSGDSGHDLVKSTEMCVWSPSSVGLWGHCICSSLTWDREPGDSWDLSHVG